MRRWTEIFATLLIASSTALRAQSVNLDLGHPDAARPGDDYRGAALPGRWNKLDALDTSAHFPLYGRDGAPIAATLHQIGGTEIVTATLGGPADPAGNDGILLGDALVTHTATENCLFVDGLVAGTYEIVTYAWMPTAPATPNRVRIDNNATITTVGGAWPGTQTETVTFARHFVDVIPGGTMGIHSGVPSGGNYTVGAALDAVQIRKLETAPPMFMSRTQIEWLASLGATSYDVVCGSLSALRVTGGDFSASIVECLANNVAATHIPFAVTPAVGDGLFLLVRGVGAGGSLTWDEAGGAQVGSRDAEINAAPAHCP